MGTQYSTPFGLIEEITLSQLSKLIKNSWLADDCPHLQYYRHTGLASLSGIVGEAPIDEGTYEKITAQYTNRSSQLTGDDLLDTAVFIDATKQFNSNMPYTKTEIVEDLAYSAAISGQFPKYLVCAASDKISETWVIVDPSHIHRYSCARGNIIANYRSMHAIRLLAPDLNWDVMTNFETEL